MCEHENKNCPRCNTHFQCKVGSILLCQCNAVILNEKEREHLQKNYNDCLCANCLQEIKSDYASIIFEEKMSRISVLFSTKKLK